MMIARADFCFIAQAAILTFCSGCGALVSHWPPAVSSKADIEKLPISQTDIRAIGIGDEELRTIAERFPRLGYLYLNSGKISDRGLAHLGRCSRLYQVVIENGGRISDGGVSALAGLPSLRELSIHNAPSITDSSLQALGNVKGLKLLYLFDCPALSDRAKSSLSKRLPGCHIHFE